MGGAVRDLWLGRHPADFDFVVPDPRLEAAHAARVLGGRAFPLDEARGHWRVVKEGLTLDYAPLPPGGLVEDLLRRDFTVNALAANQRGLVLGPRLARHDLAHGWLRAVRRQNLWDDPLRSLRAVRLAYTLGFKLEARTARWVRAHAEALRFGARPAWERVRDELEKLLASPRAANGFLELQRQGLLAAYLPELAAGVGVVQGGYHHLEVFRHQLEVLAQLVRIHPEADPALRWAALLHDVAKPLVRQWDPQRGYYRFFGHAEVGAGVAREVLKRLREPTALVRRVYRLVRHHMHLPPKHRRGLLRWVHKHRVLLPDLLYLQIADREATRGPRANPEETAQLWAALETVREILERHPLEPPLLSGREVMAILGIPPGPEVGRLLRALAEAQAVGDVRTPEEARAFIRLRHEAEASGA